MVRPWVRPAGLGPAGWTIAVFGALALGMGIVGLLAPRLLLAGLGFEFVGAAERPATDYTPAFLMASSMASLNMGVYYLLAAITDTRRFFSWTVPFRMLTFCVFSVGVLVGYAPPRFFAVAAWELAGALATGAALVYEQRHARGAGLPLGGSEKQ